MPTFLDGHSTKGLTPQMLEKLVNLPADKFGVTHLELLYNKNEDRLYCLLDAPSEEPFGNIMKRRVSNASS